MPNYGGESSGGSDMGGGNYSGGSSTSGPGNSESERNIGFGGQGYGFDYGNGIGGGVENFDNFGGIYDSLSKQQLIDKAYELTGVKYDTAARSTALIDKIGKAQASLDNIEALKNAATQPGWADKVTLQGDPATGLDANLGVETPSFENNVGEMGDWSFGEGDNSGSQWGSNIGSLASALTGIPGLEWLGEQIGANWNTDSSITPNDMDYYNPQFPTDIDYTRNSNDWSSDGFGEFGGFGGNSGNNTNSGFGGSTGINGGGNSSNGGNTGAGLGSLVSGNTTSQPVTNTPSGLPGTGQGLNYIPNNPKWADEIFNEGEMTREMMSNNNWGRR